MDIGWIGLGDMGQVIIPRLLEAGHRVRGWNRTIEKAEPLAALGMEVASSAADAARGAQVVFSVVTDSRAVRAVATGEDGIIEGLGADAIYMDMSTIDPLVSREVAAAFADRGLTMLDVPLSGSPVTVRQGKASMMVGGAETDFERVKSVLLDIGAHASHTGPQGTAVQMKVAINLTLIVEMVAFCESVALAEKEIGRAHV